MSQRRCWTRSHEDGRHFGSNISSPAPAFHLHMHFKSCVYLCPPQNYTGTAQKLLISDAAPLLHPISAHAFPAPQLRPEGWSPY